jgi:hypothetical protein
LSCRILVAVAAVVEHHVRRPPVWAAQVYSMHDSHSSSVSPFQTKTGTPVAAAAWSWVEKMLHELQRTVAPS